MTSAPRARSSASAHPRKAPAKRLADRARGLSLAAKAQFSAIRVCTIGALATSLPLVQAVSQSSQVSIDLGGLALRYADSVNATAAAVTPDFRYDTQRASVEGVGTLSQFASGGWSSQGSLATSVFAPTTGRLFFELAGFAGGSYHHDGTRTGEAIADGKVHFSEGNYGAFGGGGIGTTWSVAGWRRILLGEAGVWGRQGPTNGLLTVSPVSVDDTTRYADGQISLGSSVSRFDLSVLAGYRWGSRLPADLTGTKGWASFSATGWLTPVWGVVAAAGTYPVDPTQGFPGGRFVSLSVRLASHRNNSAPLQNFGLKSGPATASEAEPEPIDQFRVRRDAQGRTVLRIHAPSAKRVEIAGDFNQWVPTNLEPAPAGWWTVALELPPGNYQMNFRLDGGTWLVPPGMLSMKDEFGGVTGLLVIE
jgi:hypothetical protein